MKVGFSLGRSVVSSMGLRGFGMGSAWGDPCSLHGAEKVWDLSMGKDEMKVEISVGEGQGERCHLLGTPAVPPMGLGAVGWVPGSHPIPTHPTRTAAASSTSTSWTPC